ncbi:MAG: TolC family protein [Chthoniobacteraceae bacterium]
MPGTTPLAGRPTIAIIFTGAALLLAIAAHASAPPETTPRVVRISLPDFLRMVMAQNQTIQAQILGAEAARHRSLAEYGAFEPELTGSAQHVENRRPNTVEQTRNLGGVPILDEKNNLFDAGLEALTITGAKIRLGYTLNNYKNNLPPFGTTDTTKPAHTDEWQSFAGATITQPLLKNGGPTAALANLRLAALTSDEAFQEYRRQCMVTLAQAETAYWNVYFSREQLRFLDESVAVAESLHTDAIEKVRAGKGTELDILEAEAGLALRRTKRTEAQQKLTETSGQLLVFVGRAPMSPEILEPSDQPDAHVMKAVYKDVWTNALELNPDYLIQKKKRDETLVRLGVAKNQRLPELNLKGSYGYNGLGDSPNTSYSDLEDGGFPSWSAGVEFRLPVWGGIRGRHELSAVRASLLQADKQLANVETQIATALNTSVQKLKSSQSTVGNYRAMLKFNEELLTNERQRLAAGKVEGRRVLEVEAGLFDVRQGLAESLVNVQRAELEVQLAEGSILQRLGLEITPQQLKEQTLAFLAAEEKAARAERKQPGRRKRGTPRSADLPMPPVLQSTSVASATRPGKVPPRPVASGPSGVADPTPRPAVPNGRVGH